MAVLVSCSSGTDTTTATTSRVVTERRDATEWSARAAAAYKPLRLTGVELPERVRAWQAGERSAEELRADLDTAQREVTSVRDRVAALPPFARDARVLPLYRWSSRIYVEYVNALQAALGQPPDQVALRDQLVLLGRRLRILGDRIFDRGQARLAPFLHEQPNPDVEIRLPPEVPDWVADGLAAGQPWDNPPGPPADTPALRDEDRPTQPRSSWAAAVRGAAIPTTAELIVAIESADLSVQSTLANRFADLARSLGTVADPAGRHGREDAAQLRLALLVYGEAARASEAGLVDMAKRLADIGDAVFSVPGVPRRS
jgi:hypothetical protein